MRLRVLAAVLAYLLAVFSLGAAQRAKSARDMEREAQIEKDLGQAHPELVEPLRAARAAFDNGDYKESARVLRDMVAKAPDYDVAYRRLGGSLVEAGQRAEGLQFCEKAVALNRSAENLGTLAYCLVYEQASDTHRAEYERASALLREARPMPHGADLSDLALTAQVALALDNQAEFQSAAAALAQKHPNEIVTHYFGAIQAALDQQWLRSEKEIRKAEKLGMSHEAAEKFLDSGVRSRARWSHVMVDTALVIGSWAGGLILLFTLGLLLSWFTLRQVEQADPQAAITGGERLIRKFYRVILNVGGVYYYISLPVVILIVVGIVALILYLFLMIGRIPIKLMLILGLGALFTIIAMVKSLFIRVKSSDPGRALQRSEAEGLWKLTEEVAQSVGTRPIDEIRITPGTDLAVYERGTWQQKLRNEAHRILILGTGVLGGFKQRDFQCVLAHEYGHFSNRDTAGGDIALRVRNDIFKFYLAMLEAGQASYINAAFHFLRIYNFIFRRLSHGATRLQEILADRVAAQIYGAAAFESGLTHVIRRSIEFEAAANEEIKRSIDGARPLQNLYELPAPEGGEAAAELEKALSRQTSQDDTHPSPKDRFRLVARVQQRSGSSHDGEVWDLFNDPEAIRREMVAQIEKEIAPHRQGKETEAVQ